MTRKTEDRTDKIISQMIQYLETVLEQPHAIFGGLPICPFAKKARLQNKILFKVMTLQAVELALNADLMQAIEEFYGAACYEVMLVISPDTEALSVHQVDQLVINLNEKLAFLELVVFGGHPDDNFNIQGVRTRQEPYINLTVQPLEILKAASRNLQETNYYQHWSSENLRDIGFRSRGFRERD